MGKLLSWPEMVIGIIACGFLGFIIGFVVAMIAADGAGNFLLHTLVGAFLGTLAAIAGGILGGWAQGLFWYRYDKRRSNEERRYEWERKVYEWIARDRIYSFRHVDLHGANLAGVDLHGLTVISKNHQKDRIRADFLLVQMTHRGKMLLPTTEGTNG